MSGVAMKLATSRERVRVLSLPSSGRSDRSTTVLSANEDEPPQHRPDSRARKGGRGYFVTGTAKPLLLNLSGLSWLSLWQVKAME